MLNPENGKSAAKSAAKAAGQRAKSSLATIKCSSRKIMTRTNGAAATGERVAGKALSASSRQAKAINAAGASRRVRANPSSGQFTAVTLTSSKRSRTSFPGGSTPSGTPASSTPPNRRHDPAEIRNIGAGTVAITVNAAGYKIVHLDEDARHSVRELEAMMSGATQITIVDQDERKLPVSGALLATLAGLTSALEDGTLILGATAEPDLSSQEAADLLNVSRPYVVKLARIGELRHHRVGNRHRFELADVLAYREQMRATTEESLAELAPADGYTASDF